MSTYIQRTKALAAALILALAMAFGLASTQQAYAADGGVMAFKWQGCRPRMTLMRMKR